MTSFESIVCLNKERSILKAVMNSFLSSTATEVYQPVNKVIVSVKCVLDHLFSFLLLLIFWPCGWVNMNTVIYCLFFMSD